MASIKQFGTREKANQGVKLFLKDASGKETAEWVTVLGIDADTFQRANRRMRSQLLATLEDKGIDFRQSDEYIDQSIKQQRGLQASLVKDWSFDEECTSENVTQLFCDAPYIAEQVDEFASKRARFVSTWQESSEPLPNNKSASPSLPHHTPKSAVAST